MKITRYLTTALLALAGVALVAPSAKAQNANFAPGDLLLGFQLTSGVGSDQTVLINLGNTATVFRDATGPFSLGINIASILNNTYGVGAGNATQWYENTNLYFGLAGCWSNQNPSSSLQNGDPERTLYVSKSRSAVGDESIKNSTMAAVGSNTNMTNAATGIVFLQNVLETQFASGTAVVPTSTANTWEEYNPFSGSVQSTAFSVFAGGVQQAFGAGSYGTFSNGAAEGAVDLYRFQAVNNIAGQYNFGGTNRAAEYQGTVTIAQNGDVLFVPEPSTAVLLGFGVLGMAARRRRQMRNS